MNSSFKLGICLVFLMLTLSSWGSDGLSCRLTSTMDPTQPIKKSFVLNGSTEIHVGTDLRIALEGDGNKSKISIYQNYGSDDSSYILYQLSCDGNLNCNGGRTQKSPTNQSTSLFTFAPATVAIASIGNRELFQFHPMEDGFQYEFVDYVLGGKNIGLKVDCHE
jgi:hypothetical protein